MNKSHDLVSINNSIGIQKWKKVLGQEQNKVFVTIYNKIEYWGPIRSLSDMMK